MYMYVTKKNNLFSGLLPKNLMLSIFYCFLTEFKCPQCGLLRPVSYTYGAIHVCHWCNMPPLAPEYCISVSQVSLTMQRLVLAQAQFGSMRQTSLLTEHTGYVYVCGSYITYIKVSINCSYLCRNSCSLVPRPNFLLTLT